MKKLRKIFLIITILLLLMPVLNMNVKHDQISEITNSVLTELNFTEGLSS